MNYKHITLVFCLLILSSCKEAFHNTKIEGRQIKVADTIAMDEEIESFIKPYRTHLNATLDSVLAYSVDTYSKRDGEFNTAIGNMMADAVYEQANKVFNMRTGNTLDFVLLNHGGIRSIISKGDITLRTAYEVMPFENSVVVVNMPGENVQELLSYLTKAKRAHPISQLNIILDQDGNLKSANVKGEPIDPNRSYFVATNDYLYNGGDRMTFFQPNNGLEVLDYKIRNVLIDHFTQIDTLNPVIDDRFIQLKD